jgi:4-amino-4-deoxy-L-arabinose transferase-like glycosyltransferase
MRRPHDVDNVELTSREARDDVTPDPSDPAPRTAGDRRFLIGIFLLALGVRVAVGLGTDSWHVPPDDDHWAFGYEMGRIAGSLAAGHGFSYPTDPPQPTAWMAPAYPIFLSAVFRIFGIFSPASALVTLGAQAAVSALSCVLLFILATRFFDRSVGRMSAVLLTFYPASIHFAVQKIWATTFSTALLILLVILFIRNSRSPSALSSVLVGACCGLAALLDPVLVSACAALVVWMICVWARHHQGGVTSLTLLLAFAVLTITPWTLRNYFLFDRLVPIKSNFGHELLIGNHPTSNGLLPEEMSGIERSVRGYMNPLAGIPMTSEEIATYDEMNEAETNRQYLMRGIENVAHDPTGFVIRSLHRFIRFWTLVRPPRDLFEGFSHVVYFMVLVSAIPGIRVALKRRCSGLPLLIVLAVYPIAYYVTVVGLYRYRFPVEPLLIVFSAVALTNLKGRLRDVRRDRTA